MQILSSFSGLLDFFWFLFVSSAKAIDEYASLKSKATESNAEAEKVDSRLEAIVERMLDKYAKRQLIYFDMSSLFLVSYASFIQVYHGWKIPTSHGNCN